MIKIIPSFDSYINSLKLHEQNEDEIVNDYLNLPKLPFGKMIRLDKIAVLNYNFVTKQYQNKVSYLPFRIRFSDEFEKCVDPELDYTDEEQVAPVIFVSGSKKYRIRKELWYSLRDIVDNILRIQGKTLKKCLPIRLYIDKKEQFVANLFNKFGGFQKDGIMHKVPIKINNNTIEERNMYFKQMNKENVKINDEIIEMLNKKYNELKLNPLLTNQ
jgi:hypothetical protein